MCSISGYTGTHRPGIFKSFKDLLHHRGPDDYGSFEDERVHLSMNRLAIIDLKNGNQPIFNDAKDMMIILNGEIYNYIELKRILTKGGFKFNTKSDTEVVLKSYEKWGVDFLNKLNGMFALVIYDINTSKVILARDHLGEKPLYYFHTKEENNLFFASEYNALANTFNLLGDGENHFNEESVAWYFGFKAMPSENSINKHIYKLAPGTFLSYNLDSKSYQIKKYYSIKKQPTSTSTEKDLLLEFEHLFINSIKIRMRSDVEIASYLSGGVDSSLITAIASNFTSKKIKTYSLVYDEEINYKSSDEFYADLVSERYNTNHKKVLLTPDNFIEDLPKIIKQFGQPNCAVFSNWFLSKEISKSVKVALSGDGADELFGSYFLHRIAAANDSTSNYNNCLQNLTDYEKTFFHKTKNDFFNMIDHFAIFNSIERDKLFKNNDLNSKINHKLKKKLQGLTSNTSLDRMLEYDCNNLLVDQVLNYTDLLSMAHSLEVRVPFLDTRLVKFAFSIPSRYKIKNGITKYLLKKVAEFYLPKDLVHRPKEGFIEPNIYWLKKNLEEYTKHIILSDKFDKHQLFNKKYINELINDFYLHGNFYIGKKVWCLLMYGIYESVND